MCLAPVAAGMLSWLLVCALLVKVCYPVQDWISGRWRSAAVRPAGRGARRAWRGRGLVGRAQVGSACEVAPAGRGTTRGSHIGVSGKRGGARAARRVAREARTNARVERARAARWQRWRRVCAERLPGRAGGGERRPRREFVRGRAEREHVDVRLGPIVRLEAPAHEKPIQNRTDEPPRSKLLAEPRLTSAPHVLGREVARVTFGAVARCGADRGDRPKVAEFQLPPRIDEDVARLDVAVDVTARVNVHECVADVAQPAHETR